MINYWRAKWSKENSKTHNDHLDDISHQEDPDDLSDEDLVGGLREVRIPSPEELEDTKRLLGDQKMEFAVYRKRRKSPEDL